MQGLISLFTLCVRIEAVVSVNSHLTVALVTPCGRAHVVLSTFRTLQAPTLLAATSQLARVANPQTRIAIVALRVRLRVVGTVTLLTRYWITCIPMAMALTSATPRVTYTKTYYFLWRLHLRSTWVS
jgi:hypothetical protein